MVAPLGEGSVSSEKDYSLGGVWLLLHSSWKVRERATREDGPESAVSCLASRGPDREVVDEAEKKPKGKGKPHMASSSD